MKSIVLITFENIWRCVQPLIVVGIAVKKFSNTVSSSKFKSRIQFLSLGIRLPMGYSTFRRYLLRFVQRLVTGVAVKNFHDPNRATVS